MRTSVAAAGIYLLLAGLPASGQPDGRVSPDALAAKALRHSAEQLMHASGKPLARAARLVAIAKFADRLAPDDPKTNRILAFVHASRDKRDLLIKAVAVCRTAWPNDNAMALKWLELELESRQDASSRTKLLTRMVADAKQPAALRAAAAVHWAGILAGQGQPEKSAHAFDAALKLDPYLPAALRGRLASAEKPTPADRARMLSGLLAGNPRSVGVAAQLAGLFDSAGLYDHAARFYDYAWQADRQAGRARDVSHDFVIRYCNALLNAGQYERAVSTFQPLTKRFSNSLLLRSLLVEACRATGDDKQAEKFAREIEAIFAPRMVGGELTTAAAAELAWMKLVTRGDARQALRYARRAAATTPDDPDVRRVLAAARLVSGRDEDVQAGRDALKKIADKDVFAAAFLAEHYFKTGKNDEGKGLVLAGLSLSHSGQAARRLRALAEKHKITVPAAPESEALSAVAEDFEPEIFEMGLSPAKFVSVTIRPLADRSAPGEPLAVEAVLKNIGKLPVSVGRGGLAPSALSLSVSVKGDVPREFKDLRLLVWPAPRYLEPGGSVKAAVRIDVGALSDWLAIRPLTAVELQVSGKLVGAAGNGQPAGALPGVAPGAATITRSSLLAPFAAAGRSMAESYRKMLGAIAGDIKAADPVKRMLAARQAASLLALIGAVKTGKADLPRALSGEVSRPALVRMVAVALRDRSDLVRAEMLASLQRTRLDGPVIRQLAAVIHDTSALVRFRLVELLGTSGLTGQKPILDHFAKDRYDLVAEMANACLRALPASKKSK